MRARTHLRFEICSLLCPHLEYSSYSYGFIRKVAVISENNTLLRKLLSVSRYCSLEFCL